MADLKKSFLLYFDMYPMISRLPAEQKGELLDALFLFAQKEAEKQGSGESVPGQRPDMKPETEMAFRFMAETIRRDTDKWREKHVRYQKAAQERGEKRQNNDLRRYVQEMRERLKESE